MYNTGSHHSSTGNSFSGLKPDMFLLLWVIYCKSVASIAFISLLLLPFFLVILICACACVYSLKCTYKIYFKKKKKNLKWGEVPKFQSDSSIAIVFGGLVLQ